jgi:hypothetical protein
MDNVRDITEKSIRLEGLRLKSETNKVDVPMEFSYVITNDPAPCRKALVCFPQGVTHSPYGGAQTEDE